MGKVGKLVLLLVFYGDPDGPVELLNYLSNGNKTDGSVLSIKE